MAQRTKTETKTQDRKLNRAVHRPLTIRVESVSELPAIRELPQDTQISINLKGDRKMGFEIMQAIAKQLADNIEIDFFAVTITGVS